MKKLGEGGGVKIGYFVTKILTLILLRTLLFPRTNFFWNVVFPRLCNVREGAYAHPQIPPGLA